MYCYEEQKSEIFCESGQEMFLAIRDNVHHLLKQAGAVRIEEAIRGQGGNDWTKLACVDRLVELGEIKEITSPNVVAQHRIFIAT